MLRLLFVALFVLLVIGCESDDAAPRPEDSPVSVIEVASADEIREHLRETDASVVALNVWATWCVPCIAEFPMLVDFAERRRGEGVAVRFLSVDEPSELEEVRAFLRDHQVSDPSFISTGQNDIVMQLDREAGRFGAIPVTLFFNREREVVARHVGMTNEDALTSTVDRLLQEQGVSFQSAALLPAAASRFLPR